jgi:hypothetical protein
MDIIYGPSAILIISAKTAIGITNCIDKARNAISDEEVSFCAPINLSILIIDQVKILDRINGQENKNNFFSIRIEKNFR